MTEKFTKKSTTLFFIVKVFFLKPSFISALMIVVNLLFFSSIHCCFVHLRFLRTCLWRISALKEERKYERVVLSLFVVVLFVLSVTVFGYNGLKQSLILQTKPNRFLQISSFHRIFMFILRKYLALYVETWVRVCCYVRHLCLQILFSISNLR